MLLLKTYNHYNQVKTKINKSFIDNISDKVFKIAYFFNLFCGQIAY